MYKSCPHCSKQILPIYKFCSQSCATTYRNLNNPNVNHPHLKPCLQCQTLTKNPKFCSYQCAGKNSNHKQPRYCKGCNILLSIGWCNHIFCKACVKSDKNPNYRDWSKVILIDFFSKLANYQANARIRSLAREIYKKSDKPKFCTKCGYTKFYEVCHIKPIADFPKETTSIAQVNDLSNLVALCPNCHWELDHNLITIN